VNGTVIGLSLQEGEFVTAGQPLLALTDFSEWVIKTDDLTELEVIDVKNGQTVEIILDAFPETLMTGSIVDIASRYEEKRGDVTFTVTITLDNLADGARWGMTGQVIFDSIE
jgi:multidrug resistance efflux pump